MKDFDVQSWHEDPVRTVVGGVPMAHEDDFAVKTTDALQRVNGVLVQSPRAVVEEVLEHMQTYVSPQKDYRDKVRQVEQKLLNEYAPQLVGNQALDFHKQDGITEIEESVEANAVERNMLDDLLSAEKEQKLVIDRSPAMVGCVSNFSNFLDLFRKVLRNVEAGVPVVVLSRSNTTQHMYRWFQMLVDLFEEHGIDRGLLTYLACSIEDQRFLMSRSPSSPLYFTGSRDIAAKIKAVCPKLVASTGGPNTMYTDAWTPEVAAAAAQSACIENSGQCTALRHLVSSGPIDENVFVQALSKLKGSTAQDAITNETFASFLDDAPAPTVEGYTAAQQAQYVLSSKLPDPKLEEHWRQVVVDVTKDHADLPALAQWLTQAQPISLAMNLAGSMDPALYLFEHTSLVIYTVGNTTTAPALTAQARPQDGEVFGEFPPRQEMRSYTRFPNVVPSPAPLYNAFYRPAYLEAMALEEGFDRVHALGVDNVRITGYLCLMDEYLKEAAQGPRSGHGQRTTLWGLQRPPLDQKVVLRIESDTTMDDIAPLLYPFLATNAREQLVVSSPTTNVDLCERLTALGVAVQFESVLSDQHYWNVMVPEQGLVDELHMPLVGPFTSLLLPLGHIKSTRSDDAAFVEQFSASDKWLRYRK